MNDRNGLSKRESVKHSAEQGLGQSIADDRGRHIVPAIVEVLQPPGVVAGSAADRYVGPRLPRCTQGKGTEGRLDRPSDHLGGGLHRHENSRAQGTDTAAGPGAERHHEVGRRDDAQHREDDHQVDGYAP